MKPSVDSIVQKIPVFKKLRGKGENGSKKTSKNVFRWNKNGKSKKRIVAIIAACAAAAVLVGVRAWLLLRSNAGADFGVTYSTVAVSNRNISVTLSGSGTLEPADTYEVTSLASGEILSDSLEEGDSVEEGDVLYEIDPADAEDNIESAEVNLEKARLSYNNILENLSNLNVEAPADGTIIELNVEVGDSIGSGQSIGTVRNSAVMSLTIPFNSADVDSFSVGETAEVTLDSTFEVLTGTISKIGNVEQVTTGNMLVKYVTIDVDNPGGITNSTSATVKIGDIACNSSSAFDYKDEESVTTGTSGRVIAMYYSEGDTVQAGTTLVVLENTDLAENVTTSELSLEQAENTLESAEDALDDYTVTSPISGTVVTKNYKAGDKLDGNSNQALCTIYDLSYLTMELSVDELDVSTVEVGQGVTITADAVEGVTYTGTVTKVSISGTTSGGVTAYPVTIRIDETEGLLPGMNVDAEIIVESAEGALSVPVDAVVRGNMVLVRTDSGVDVTELTVGDDGIPEGFEYVEVTLGVNDDDYIEVTSGLSEGDVVAIATVIADDGEANSTPSGLGILTGNTGGTSGNFSGGDMPSGGGGGGNMPSGGGNGGPMGG